MVRLPQARLAFLLERVVVAREVRLVVLSREGLGPMAS